MSESEETQYLSLIREVIEKGSIEEGRNGRVRVVFGRSMRFTLQDGTLPLLTTKRVAWKTCFEELRWFIQGSTNNQDLKNKKVSIWNGNATREFLDSRGLTNLEEDDLGPVYGHQWRHFNAPYENCHTNYQGKGIDQLQEVINTLKDPSKHTSRRILMSSWNPVQLDEMALPPCHVLTQFHVREGKYLSCCLYQRSGDIGLGVPFNIVSYSFLTHILAKHCNLEADEFVYFLGNCHIYEDHLEPLQEQITREPFSFPKIQISKQHETIEAYCLDDIEWTKNYEYHSAIRMKMVA
jgi:thymidylate synthase